MTHKSTPKRILFQRLATAVLPALLCSCTGTSVKKTWKSPEFAGSPYNKIAVVVLDDRQSLRRKLENRFVTELSTSGASAITTVDILSLPDINTDRAAAAAKLRDAGAEAVVGMRLAASAASFREVRPGAERYAGVTTGYEYDTWYNYYSVAYMDMSPTYDSMRQHVYIEISLFDLKSGKRLWSGITQTVLTETMDPVDEIKPLAVKVVAAMRKDGVVP